MSTYKLRVLDLDIKDRYEMYLNANWLLKVEILELTCWVEQRDD